MPDDNIVRPRVFGRWAKGDSVPKRRTALDAMEAIGRAVDARDVTHLMTKNRKTGRLVPVLAAVVVEQKTQVEKKIGGLILPESVAEQQSLMPLAQLILEGQEIEYEPPQRLPKGKAAYAPRGVGKAALEKQLMVLMELLDADGRVVGPRATGLGTAEERGLVIQGLINLVSFINQQLEEDGVVVLMSR